MGKLAINRSFSITILDYQRVINIVVSFPVPPLTSRGWSRCPPISCVFVDVRQPLFLAEELVGIPMQVMDGSPAQFWKSEKNRWGARRINGFSMDFLRIFYGFLWFSMVFYGFSMVFHGFLWLSMVGFLWVFYGFPAWFS